MSHPARVYHTKDAWLASLVDSPSAKRWGIRYWKRHVAKRGNVPLVLKCGICSGQERRLDIKHGAYKPKRQSKRLRDEARTVEP